jgi:hypothetical protein
MTSGYLGAAYLIYIVWLAGATLFALNSLYVFYAIQKGNIEPMQELKFIQMNLPQQVVLHTACHTAISTVLTFSILNSVFIPVLMLSLFIIRCLAARQAIKVIQCLK